MARPTHERRANKLETAPIVRPKCMLSRGPRNFIDLFFRGGGDAQVSTMGISTTKIVLCERRVATSFAARVDLKCPINIGKS